MSLVCARRCRIAPTAACFHAGQTISSPRRVSPVSTHLGVHRDKRLVVEPFSYYGNLAADCPNPLSFQTFTLVIANYVVVLEALRGFQQLKRIPSEDYSSVGLLQYDMLRFIVVLVLIIVCRKG